MEGVHNNTRVPQIRHVTTALRGKAHAARPAGATAPEYVALQSNSYTRVERTSASTLVLLLLPQLGMQSAGCPSGSGPPSFLSREHAKATDSRHRRSPAGGSRHKRRPLLFFFLCRGRRLACCRLPIPSLWVRCIYGLNFCGRPCLFSRKFCKIFHIPHHIESLDACMKY